MYDPFGPESDFDSELSWISYPPRHGFLRDFWEHNPHKMAEDAVFKEKIKYKYQYNNCTKEVYPVPAPVPKTVLQAKRTQTFSLQTDPNFEPFANANQFSESSDSEVMSAIDQGTKLCNFVIGEGFSSDSTVQADGLSSERAYSRPGVASRVSRKRQGEKGRAQGMLIETDSKNMELTDAGDGDIRLGTVFDRDGKVIYDKNYNSVRERKTSEEASKAEGITAPLDQDSVSEGSLYQTKHR